MDRMVWEALVSQVAEAMKIHTRPFVTTLAKETPETVRHVGTASFLQLPTGTFLVTCEHVAKYWPLDFGFYGSDDRFRRPGPWCVDVGLDVAVAPVTPAHSAQAIPYTRVDTIHRPVQHELLFFRGIAFENTGFAFETHETRVTGFCSQEVPGGESARDFEVHWDADKIQFTDATPPETRSAMSSVDPSGMSGSLVWNTRYVEFAQQSKPWSPEVAVVTGLLQRWDPDTKSLLAHRIEHLRLWLEFLRVAEGHHLAKG